MREADRDRVWLALTVLGLVYLSVNATNGPAGWLSRIQMQDEEKRLSRELADIRAQGLMLENQLRLLASDAPTSDYVEERASKVLGYAREDEWVVVFPDGA